MQEVETNPTEDAGDILMSMAVLILLAQDGDRLALDTLDRVHTIMSEWVSLKDETD